MDISTFLYQLADSSGEWTPQYLMSIKLDMYQMVGVAILVYYLGQTIRARFPIFEKYCIPIPVIGGVIFSLVNLVLNVSGILDLDMDDTLQKVFMTIFFTSIGYTASLKLLKKGGTQVMVLLAICTVLVILQNIVGVSLAMFFDLNSLLGLCTGSIPMVGGHGTAGSFGPLLESLDVVGANTVGIAAATFGLVMGGIIGGPVAKKLIEKNHLVKKAADGHLFAESEFVEEDTVVHVIENGRFMHGMGQLFLAIGFGTLVTAAISSTGMTFPAYIGAMLVAALIRNISDLTHKYEVYSREIDVLGSVSLSIFLCMALMGLKLWQLAALALPLVVMLLAQTILMVIYSYFVVFNVMGRDYEAAVMSSASCGFGMGATPNAMANMNAITSEYGPAPKAFFVVPLIGSLFIDFVNASVITLFINLFK